MGNLTRAAYAKSAYDAFQEIGKISNTKAEYDEPRYVEQSMWRVFIIHVFVWAFADAPWKTWMFENTPLFFSAQVERCSRSRAERKRDKGERS